MASMLVHNTQQRREVFFGKTNRGEEQACGIAFAEDLPGRKC